MLHVNSSEGNRVMPTFGKFLQEQMLKLSELCDCKREHYANPGRYPPTNDIMYECEPWDIRMSEYPLAGKDILSCEYSNHSLQALVET